MPRITDILLWPARLLAVAARGRLRSGLGIQDRGQYTEDEIEFARAMDEYKRRHNRPYPHWSEVLEVLKYLGYEKRPEPPHEDAAPERPDA